MVDNQNKVMCFRCYIQHDCS